MKKSYAFSIVELLLVLAAVAILCSITIPKFFSLQERALDHDIDKLFMVCSYVQQKAISRHEPQQIIFNKQKNSYTYLGLHGKKKAINLSHGIQFGFIPGVLGSPGDPKTPISMYSTFKANMQQPGIIFFHNGAASAGTVYFVDSKQKLMGALTCGLSQVSYVRKYRYKNKKRVVLR